MSSERLLAMAEEALKKMEKDKSNIKIVSWIDQNRSKIVVELKDIISKLNHDDYSQEDFKKDVEKLKKFYEI